MARPTTKKRASKKPYPRKFRLLFAYPMVIFWLLVTGVYLTAWTLKAKGADIRVTAAVHAPLVISPAVITSPKNNQHFKNIPINVSGTCPANAGYVEIFRNNLMSGTALCDAQSKFQLSIDLSPGRNDLTARVFNITDDEGPVSATVTVFFDAPKPRPEPAASQNGGSGGALASPFVLTTAFVYKGYYTGQEVQWPLRISGGTPPYAISVDWGDGSNDVISRGAAGDFSINHTYFEQGRYKNSFVIKINGADSAGQKAFLQFFIIVNSKAGNGLAGGIFSKPPPSLGSGHSWLWLAWPAYMLVLIMFFSYWLGEREEMIILRRKGLLKR